MYDVEGKAKNSTHIREIGKVRIVQNQKAKICKYIGDCNPIPFLPLSKET
jgi:hypothetical protein